MATTSLFLAVTESCTKSSTASAVVGLVILLGIVAAVVALALANGHARTRLAAANNELSYLRPENARLQQWIAHLTGAPIPGAPVSPYPTGTVLPSQWYPDPAGRHELRYWDGENWTGHVSDHGVTSLDPPEK